MSSPSSTSPRLPPLIVLLHQADRAMQLHMVKRGKRLFPQGRLAYNAVFGQLPVEGARASDLAAGAGITRQSMGEVIREMVEAGVLEMKPDPNDGRAKLVTYTEWGLALANEGRQHILGLERRFAEEFGEAEYATARDVLERLVGVLAEVEATFEEEATETTS